MNEMTEGDYFHLLMVFNTHFGDYVDLLMDRQMLQQYEDNFGSVDIDNDYNEDAELYDTDGDDEELYDTDGDDEEDYYTQLKYKQQREDEF